MRSSALIRSYSRAKRQRKVLLSIFFLIFVATCVWAMPWTGVGLSKADYNDRLTVLLLLVMGSATSAFGAIYMKEVSHRAEQTLLTWSSVHDGLGDLRRREYFYERVVLECQRAEKSDREFSVIVLKLRESEASAIDATLAKFEPMVKEFDCVSVLTPLEIGVMAPRATASEAQRVSEILAAQLASAAGRDAYVHTGFATYPLDAKDAGSLIGVARERLNGRPAAAA